MCYTSVVLLLLLLLLLLFLNKINTINCVCPYIQHVYRTIKKQKIHECGQQIGQNKSQLSME